MLQSVEGDEKTGKTTYLYTAPLSIVAFAFDMGIERAIKGAKYKDWFEGLKIQVIPFETPPKPAWQGYDITVYELPPPIQLNTIRVRGCLSLWDYFIELAAEALIDPQVRTVGVDTMTIARRIKADAYLEGLQNESEREKKPLRERLLQVEWGNPNDAIRNLYTTAAGLKKNLVAVHHMTDERTDGIDKDGRVVQGLLTGKRILEGLNHTYRFVDLALRFTVQDRQPVAALVKCGYNLGLEGSTLANPTWNTIAQLIEDSLGGTLTFERQSVGGDSVPDVLEADEVQRPARPVPARKL